MRNVAGLPILRIVLFAAWILVPLICILVLALPRWIYTDDDPPLPFFWKHVRLIVGLCWALYFLAMLSSSPHFDPKHQDLRWLAKSAAGVILFSCVAGGGIGGLAFGLFNCTADHSEGQEAAVQKVKQEWRTVIFLIEQPFPAMFKCNQGKWYTAHEEGRRFFVHPGRLGAVWGEFR